jgi:hypothetical protein
LAAFRGDHQALPNSVEDITSLVLPGKCRSDKFAGSLASTPDVNLSGDNHLFAQDLNFERHHDPIPSTVAGRISSSKGRQTISPNRLRLSRPLRSSYHAPPIAFDCPFHTLQILRPELDSPDYQFAFLPEQKHPPMSGWHLEISAH